MRHGEVSYFDEETGRPFSPDDVSLNREGRAQAAAAGAMLAGTELDLVVTSGLRRTMETAAIVAPTLEAEALPELQELKGGHLSAIPPDELEEVFVHAFRGVVPNESRFLGGESVGELFDRVLPALDRLLARDWTTALAILHGGVNRAILSWVLLGERTFLGHFEQAPACVNVLDLGDEWIVRAVNLAAYDLPHAAHRQTTMERYWDEYRATARDAGL
jgi:probable phosphoglycerate mutase